MGSEEIFLALSEEVTFSNSSVVTQQMGMLRVFSAPLLDEDLALLYQVESKHVKRRVKINLERPPPLRATIYYQSKKHI